MIQKSGADIHAPKLIATHCESSPIIDKNFHIAKEKYGDNIPLEMHTQIRSRECCIESSSLAINLAKKLWFPSTCITFNNKR